MFESAISHELFIDKLKPLVFLSSSEKKILHAVVGFAVNSVMPGSASIPSSCVGSYYDFYVKDGVSSEIVHLLEEFLRSFNCTDYEISKIERPSINCIEWARFYGQKWLIEFFNGHPNTMLYGVRINEWCEFYLHDFGGDLQVNTKNMYLNVEKILCKDKHILFFRLHYACFSSLSEKKTYSKNIKASDVKYDRAIKCLSKWFLTDCGRIICANDIGTDVFYNFYNHISLNLKALGFNHVMSVDSGYMLDNEHVARLASLYGNHEERLFWWYDGADVFKNICAHFVSGSEKLISNISTIFKFMLSLCERCGLRPFLSVKSSGSERKEYISLIDEAVNCFGKERCFFDDESSECFACFELFAYSDLCVPFLISDVLIERVGDVYRVYFRPVVSFYSLLVFWFTSFGCLPVFVAYEHVRVIMVNEESMVDGHKLRSDLHDSGIKSSIDCNVYQTVAERVRSAALDGIPYVVIWGSKDSRDRLPVKDISSGCQKLWCFEDFVSFVLSSVL